LIAHVRNVTVAVRAALVLAAGNGDRFHNGTRQSKLLTRLLGVPLLVRTLKAARRAGVRVAHLVVGYQAEDVRAAVEHHVIPGLQLAFHHNPRWHEENGLSVLAARHALTSERFALLMGDHIFDWRVLQTMLRTPAATDESLLAVDRRSIHGERAAEATKVRTVDGRIVAIGKDLEAYDALDTGVFVCAPSVFASLDDSCRDGDTTLSGGIRRLATRGLVRAVETGASAWCDVDTVDDLADAERLLRVLPRSRA
jgi:choline kinase